MPLMLECRGRDHPVELGASLCYRPAQVRVVVLSASLESGEASEACTKVMQCKERENSNRTF